MKVCPFVTLILVVAFFIMMIVETPFFILGFVLECLADVAHALGNSVGRLNERAWDYLISRL